MDQVHVLRHKVLVEGRSQRQVAKELGISRLTVRKYLAQAAPVRREAKPRARPVWDTVGARVETLRRAKQSARSQKLFQGEARQLRRV